MTDPRRFLTALAALVLLLTAACGGNDDDGDTANSADAADSADSAGDADAQAYIDAAAASLTSGAELGIDPETATCVSTAFVDLIGADHLADAGITPEQFAAGETFEVPGVATTEESSARLSEALDACGLTASLTSAFVAELGVDLPAEARTCLDDHVDSRAVTDAFAGSLLPAAGEESGSGSAGATLEATIQDAYLDATVACPAVVTAAFLAEAGTVTPEAQSCVSALVEANPDLVRAAFDDDTAAAEQLGTQIASTCPEAVGG